MQMSYPEAVATFRQHLPEFEARGVAFQPGAIPAGYATDAAKRDWTMALDALPLTMTDPNSSVPVMLTTLIDPTVFEVLFAPNKAAEIMGEVKKGTWLDDTAIFPVAEATGEVSSYGDYANNGRAGVNTSFPAVQSYSFQLIKMYGDKEMERAGLARINWVTEIDRAAALNLNKFLNYTYFFGVQGLQNYGLINSPFLAANLTPATKAAGGTTWFTAGGAPNATANEVYNDIVTVVTKLVQQTAGLVAADSPMTLAVGPTTGMALQFTNTFNVNVEDLLKKNFPNMKIVTAVQYDTQTSTNPQGVAAGNLFQIIVREVEGQQTGFAAFNEKMRAFPLVRELSASRQKCMAGTWGMILRFPAGVAAMVGV